MTFDQLAAEWMWKPIRHCPGRFVLREAPSALTPQDLVGQEIALSVFQVTAARDPVVIGSFDGGGVISYQRADGTYVHTLNTTDGFGRKLAQLGITLTSDH